MVPYGPRKVSQSVTLCVDHAVVVRNKAVSPSVTVLDQRNDPCVVPATPANIVVMQNKRTMSYKPAFLLPTHRAGRVTAGHRACLLSLLRALARAAPEHTVTAET